MRSREYGALTCPCFKARSQPTRWSLFKNTHLIFERRKSLMRNNKKRLSLTLAVLTLALCAFAFTTAYFTDREQASASATAGTLDLRLVESWADATNFKPGDKYDYTYTLANDGNKSADVRETIVITSSAAMATTGQAEFEVYASGDIKQNTDGSWVPDAGKSPLAVRSISADGKKVTYKVPEFILNGTGTAAETESGITTNTKTGSYVVLFSNTADNDFQGATITIDYLAEAKQHRNTDTTIWTTVASENITFAGNATKAVPAA